MVAGSVLVCGSRSLSVSADYLAPLVRLVCPAGWLLLSGGAFGVDAVAPALSRALGWELVIFRPDYALHGRRAPLVRNAEMASLASLVIAVWDGRSRGTKYTVDYARSLGRQVIVVPRSVPHVKHPHRRWRWPPP